MLNGTPDRAELEARTVAYIPGGRGEGLPLKFWGDLGSIAAPDRLVRRLLGTTSLAVIYGEPGCGKTFLATDIGLHIALGWPWFGRSVTPGAVIYLAGEGVAGINNRLAGFKAKHQPGENVPFVIVPSVIDLGPDGADAERVIAAVETVETHTGQAVHLIVVDTLARSMGSGDENSTRDMGQFVAACDRIRVGTGATVLVVHHRGKSSQAGARGSSALLGAADTVIEVQKLDGRRVARVVKQKDAADGVEVGFDLEVVELGEDDEGEPITTCVVAQIAGDAPTNSRRRPKGNAGIVFGALERAIEDGGEDAPDSRHFPPGVRVVSTETWRRYAYEMMAEASNDARQKAFKRAYDSLINTSHVATWGGKKWVV
jgi:hypothetical protein